MDRLRRRVALVPWGTPLEVFLDPLGASVEDFCERMTGGWLFGFAEALRLAGHEPSVVISSRTVERTSSRLHRPTGTPVTVLPARATTSRRPGLRRDLALYRSASSPDLRRVLARSDVVLLQEYEDPRTDLLAWWAAARGLPLLASFQGGSPPWECAPLQRRARSASVRRLAGVLVGSSAEQERVRGAYGVETSRLHRVVNPVDTVAWRPADRSSARARLGIPRSARVVAWHGRVDVQRKGLDVLLSAWKTICAARPETDLRLLLVGGGADEHDLRRLLHGTRGVHWLAEYAGADSVAERLAACDLWVSTSRNEGLAVAPLEAMASGRPVVLSDAPGAVDVIGETTAHGGVLVPRDSGAAVAAAVLATLEDEGLPARGRAARRRVEDAFSLAAVSLQLDTAISAATADAGRRAARTGS